MDFGEEGRGRAEDGVGARSQGTTGEGVGDADCESLFFSWRVGGELMRVVGWGGEV